MFRPLLPVVIACCTTSLAAQGPLLGAACDNRPYDRSNCVQAFACLGDTGLYARGEAYGWDAGGLAMIRSDDVICTGSWTADGPFGTGLAELGCADGLTANVIYYSQDNTTGTTLGRGTDSLGRPVQAWSGANVLEFLSRDGAPINARLPCAPGTLLVG